MFLFIFTFALTIALVLGFLVVLLSFLTNEEHLAKTSPFECGFQPFMTSGVTFSMPFFVISLMFLLFDVEIIIMSFPSFLPMLFSIFMWLIIFLIFWATCYEWFSGIFSWISSKNN